MATPRPILALACAALVALPPDWCCAVTGGTCCGDRPAPPTCRAAACPTCSDCRCKPLVPADPPVRAPAEKFACCERPDGIVERTDPPAATEPAAVLPHATDHPTSTPGVATVPPAPSPPFRILHCVWRC